ncbi:phage tail sheath subtilisin-like domain-containing protein [Sporosarcina sp. FSL K6-1508]|uniref:phage tail sheath subtilisin-like domain-containing protein n=1 Tax=Sporosarcina sp. FSL K6-1508 TaxID=2921553 RepID=UPI0030F8A3B9
MSIGAMFKLGEQKIRPGVFVRWYNAGGYKRYSRPLGVSAAVIKSNWGPIGEVVTLDTGEDVKDKLGTGLGPDVVNEIFEGGASFCHTVRIGTGGQPAEVDLEAETETVKLRTKYPTSRNFSVTVREALDPALKEIILFEGTRQIQSLTFAKGENEASALLEVVNAESKYLTATTAGSGEVEVVINEPLSGGADPDTVGEDYTDGMQHLETKFFDSITVDSEDAIIHAALHAFVRRKIREGYRMTMVVGEKPDVSFETRKSHAKAFNDFAVVYVGNGVETTTGGIVGATAAARVLGMLVSGSYKSSLTKNTITGGVGLIGEMTSNEYNEAVQSGMMVFSLNPDSIPQIDYGINTLVSLAEDEDEGWQKLRRVRTRYELIDRIAITISKAMANNIDNGHDGRQFVIQLANGIIGEMIGEGGLESGEMIIDPVTSPQGDSAWFKFDNLVDLDGLEKAYLAFGFQY